MSNELNPDAPEFGFKGVSHRFGSRTVFQDVVLAVCAGQVGIVAGANGSGKSTLLRIAAGLLEPTSGEVTLKIRGVLQDTIARRRYIGYVAPDLSLYRELTGVENLSFFARLRSIEPTHQLLRSTLEQVGLLGRGRDLVGNYSSGMRQRLKYAYALLGRPPVLILDEPTANLDQEGVGFVEALVAAQIRRPDGGIVLIGTNEPREEAWGDTLVRLTAAKRPGAP